MMCVLCCADQDRIVSPGTDSGFVGSESSRLTPAAAPSPLHQRATERWERPTLILFSAPPRYSFMQFLILLCGLCLSVPEPGKGVVPSPFTGLSQSNSHRTAEDSGVFQLSHDNARSSRQVQRTHSVSRSRQRWVSLVNRSRADSGTSEFGLQSDSSEFPSFHLFVVLQAIWTHVLDYTCLFLPNEML